MSPFDCKHDSGLTHICTRIWNAQTEEVVNIIVQSLSPMCVVRFSQSCVEYKIDIGWIARGRTALSPDFRYLAIMNTSGIDVYRVSNQRRIAALTTPAGLDGRVLFVHNGNTVLATGANGEICLWSIPQGRRMQSMRHPG